MFFSLKFKSRFLLSTSIFFFFFGKLFWILLFTRSHLQYSAHWWNVRGIVWCFPFEVSSWKHAARELRFPRLLPLMLHSCIAVHASKTFRDQLVLLWELRGPTSPTDIISYPQLFLTHCLYIHACNRLRNTLDLKRGTVAIICELHPPWLKCDSLLIALLLLFFSVLSAIDFPGLI